MSLYHKRLDHSGGHASKSDRLRQTLARIVRPLLLPAIVWAATLAAGPSCLWAQSEEDAAINREYAIKAAYLYHFGAYVQWPARSFADSEAPFVIGVVGTDPFGHVLDQIARTKRIDGRPIVVKRFASMADYAPCHILFVPSSAGPAEKAAAIRKAHGTAVLLVGENPGFARQGGTIGFFVEENKVRFEINLEVAKRQQLRISSKLLSLAKIVETS